MFILPNFLIFFTFIVIPAFYGLLSSFTNYDGLSKPEFISFENYLELFADREFWLIMLKTGSYTGIIVPLIFVVSLLLAMLLITEIKGKGVIRAIFYWPTMISAIIVGLSWKWLLGDNFGILNYVLNLIGHESVKWLTNPFNANVAVIAATLWCRAGFFMIIFISGLQSIPISYYEAVRIDGANRAAAFRHITLPLLKPTSILILILTLIEAFKVYPLIFSLTRGGPGKATTYIVQYIYEFGFDRSELGYASAMSVILFAVIGLFTIVQFKLSNGGEIT